MSPCPSLSILNFLMPDREFVGQVRLPTSDFRPPPSGHFFFLPRFFFLPPLLLAKLKSLLSVRTSFIIWASFLTTSGCDDAILFFSPISLLRSWSSSIKDGTKKDKDLGKWGDDKRYDLNQDQKYVLLKEKQLPLSATDTNENKLRLFIDPDKTKQSVLGLGASMTDSSAYVLSQLKEKQPGLFTDAMDKLFSIEKGAGFSVIRLPIGASDYTATKDYYTYCDTKSEDLSTFTIEHNKKYILPILRDALKVNPEIKFIGAPWSPPAWMKTNQSLFGVKNKDKSEGKTNRLKDECFEAYALYFVKYIQAYKKEGIDLYGITLQNEPQFDGADYPCMRMTKDDQIKLIGILGPMLEKAGLKTKILLHDHNWVLHPNDIKVVGGDKKMDPLTLIKQIYANKIVSKYVAGSAWHCYSGSVGDLSRSLSGKN